MANDPDNVVPFPRRLGPLSEAVADFKRVCDQVGVDGLREDDGEIGKEVKALIEQF